METYKELPLLEFEIVDDWRKWLDEHHADRPGVWLKSAKKGSGRVTISYEEARNTAICFGWIDGLINKYDDAYYLTRYTPRKSKSGWSKINCQVAEQQIAEGKMHPAGLAHVESAKSDGRWDLAYDSPGNMIVPEDFQLALDLNPNAQSYFNALNAANRYSFLYRIQTAKSPKARSSKIETLIAMLNAGKCLHP